MMVDDDRRHLTSQRLRESAWDPQRLTRSLFQPSVAEELMRAVCLENHDSKGHPYKTLSSSDSRRLCVQHTCAIMC